MHVGLACIALSFDTMRTTIDDIAGRMQHARYESVVLAKGYTENRRGDGGEPGAAAALFASDNERKREGLWLRSAQPSTKLHFDQAGWVEVGAQRAAHGPQGRCCSGCIGKM